MYLSKSKANSPFPLDKKKISREIILEHTLGLTIY